MNEDYAEMQQEIKRLYYIIDLLIKENLRLQLLLPAGLKEAAINNADSGA